MDDFVQRSDYDALLKELQDKNKREQTIDKIFMVGDDGTYYAVSIINVRLTPNGREILISNPFAKP